NNVGTLPTLFPGQNTLLRGSQQCASAPNIVFVPKTMCLSLNFLICPQIPVFSAGTLVQRAQDRVLAHHRKRAQPVDIDSLLHYTEPYGSVFDTARRHLRGTLRSTRRGILERLGRGDASISDLAASFEMSLTGLKKHVQILEEAGLVVTEKVGRVRTCRLGPRRLDDESAW